MGSLQGGSSSVALREYSDPRPVWMGGRRGGERVRRRARHSLLSQSVIVPQPHCPLSPFPITGGSCPSAPTPSLGQRSHPPD